MTGTQLASRSAHGSSANSPIAVGAPKLLRVYLSYLPPERQLRVGWAWDGRVASW